MGDKNRDDLHEYEQKKKEQEKKEEQKNEEEQKKKKNEQKKKEEQKINLSLALTYDKSKKQLTYVIQNTGDDIAKEVKLIYKNVSTNPGEASVCVDGKKSGETAPEDLGATTGKVTKVLPVDFNTQDKARFEFKVTCNGTTLEELTKTKELEASQVSIDLSLGLTYDESKKQLTYVINNTGEDIAKNVKLIYKNVSTDPGEASVCVDGKKSGETALEDLGATTGKITKVLSVDFNTQDKARFEFKVACNGTTLEKLTKTEELKAPQVSLKLTNDYGTTSAINLEDLDKIARILIRQSEDTPDQPVELRITRTVGASGYLSQKAGTNDGNKIIITKLDGISTYRNLYVTPEGDDTLKFELQLVYKNKPMGTPLMVSWKGKEVKLNLSWVDPKPNLTSPQFISLGLARTIEIKIEEEGGTSGLVDPRQVKLQLKKDVVGGNVIISTTKGGPEVTELTGDQFNIANQVSLYLDMDDKKVKSLILTLKLFYKEKELPGVPPLRLSWGDPDTALTNLMESFREQVVGLLQQGRLQEASKGFDDACWNRFASKTTDPKSEEIVKDIYKQIVQALEKKSQAYSSNLDNLYSSSKAIEVAEVAKRLVLYAETHKKAGSKQQDFVEKDKLKEIAKNAYTAALNKLEKELTRNFTAKDANDAEDMMEDAEKLAKAAKEYGLDATQVEKVNKAAYTAVVQSQLGVAKHQEEEVRKSKNYPTLRLDYAKNASRAAHFSAIVTKKAKDKGFESTELEKIVKEAYAAAARAECEIAEAQEEEVRKKKSYPALQPDYAMKSLQAATRAAQVANKAGKDFESPDLKQAIQEAYIAAARAELAIAKDQEEEVRKNKSYPTLQPDYATKSLQSAMRAIQVAQQAGKDFESPDLKQAVREALEFTKKAYEALNDMKYKKTIEGIERAINQYKS